MMNKNNIATLSIFLITFGTAFLLNVMPDSFGLFGDKDYKSDTYSTTREVPIIMFHDIGGIGDYSVSKKQFENQMSLIKNKGFNTISFKDLYNYTAGDEELPEKPIIITFDDSYQSNYDVAYPILKDLNMKATIYIIGHSFGKDTYKDTGEKIHPHFGYVEAIEMYKSGLIDIQGHSYDMHQSEKFEKNSPVRVSVKRFENEDEEDYIEAFNSDFLRINDIIRKITGENIHSFSYPTGYYDAETEKLLALLGVKSTVTTNIDVNTIIKGKPQSLFELKRINIYKDMHDENLMDLID